MQDRYIGHTSGEGSRPSQAAIQDGFQAKNVLESPLIGDNGLQWTVQGGGDLSIFTDIAGTGLAHHFEVFRVFPRICLRRRLALVLVASTLSAPLLVAPVASEAHRTAKVKKRRGTSNKSASASGARTKTKKTKLRIRESGDSLLTPFQRQTKFQQLLSSSPFPKGIWAKGEKLQGETNPRLVTHPSLGKLIMKPGRANKELAAHILSAELGLHFVPNVADVKFQGKSYTVSRYIERSLDASQFRYDGIRRKSDALLLFDIFIGNWDRHRENFRFQLPEGKSIQERFPQLKPKEYRLWAVDHGNAFSTWSASSLRGRHLGAGEAWKTLAPMLKAHPEFVSRLKELTPTKLETLLGTQLSPEAMKHLQQRRTYLLQVAEGRDPEPK